MIHIVLNILLYVFSIFSFISLFKWEHFTVRLWDYPKKQLLVLLSLSLLFRLFFNDIQDLISIGAIISSSIGILFITYKIAPYTSLAGKQMKNAVDSSNKSLSLLIANVQMKNDDFSKLVSQINEKYADVVMLLETDKKWQSSLKEIEIDYPYCHHLPLSNTYGMLIYSKIELKDAEFKCLVNKQIPSFHAIIPFQGKRIRFYGLHPEPPFPTQTKDTVERDAEILIVGKEIEKKNGPTIVAGDLNDVAWSYTTGLFQKISGLLDPRIGRGFFSTFHARKVWARWPLDHVFCSDHFSLIKMERLSYIGSDHFPIYLELTFDHGAKLNESPNQADREERELINSKIDKV